MTITEIKEKAARALEVAAKAHEQRCSDGNCCFIDKSRNIGQHTNGGCHCLENSRGGAKRAVVRESITLLPELAHHLKAVIRRLEVVERQRDEGTRLLQQNGWICKAEHIIEEENQEAEAAMREG